MNIITTIIIVTIAMLAWCAYHIINDIRDMFSDPY